MAPAAFCGKGIEAAGGRHLGQSVLEPDGHFPNHIPNPENKEAMEAIRQAVLTNKADLGIIFDTDVDRMSAVLPNGDEVKPGRDYCHDGSDYCGGLSRRNDRDRLRYQRQAVTFYRRHWHEASQIYGEDIRMSSMSPSV